MPVINKWTRRRHGKSGKMLPGKIPHSLAVEIEKEKQARAREWKKFRRDFLFSQSDLAQALGIGRRTVCSVEAGDVVPMPKTLRAFRELVRREKAAA